MAAGQGAKPPSNKSPSSILNAIDLLPGLVRQSVARPEKHCPREHRRSLLPLPRCWLILFCNSDECSCRKLCLAIAERAYLAAADRAWTSDYIRLMDDRQYRLQARAVAESVATLRIGCSRSHLLFWFRSRRPWHAR